MVPRNSAAVAFRAASHTARLSPGLLLDRSAVVRLVALPHHSVYFPVGVSPRVELARPPCSGLASWQSQLSA